MRRDAPAGSMSLDWPGAILSKARRSPNTFSMRPIPLAGADASLICTLSSEEILHRPLACRWHTSEVLPTMPSSPDGDPPVPAPHNAVPERGSRHVPGIGGSVVHWRGYADHWNEGFFLGIRTHNRNAALRNLRHSGSVHSKNRNEIPRILLYHSDYSSQREDASAGMSPVQDPLRAAVRIAIHVLATHSLSRSRIFRCAYGIEEPEQLFHPGHF